jgi:peptidoglycan biosynthesis protein MviN/MurJ (putative lipid II flippase)
VLLVPPLAHAGLALASSLVPIVITILYYLYLSRFIPRLASVFWHRTYFKTIVLAGALAIAVSLVKPTADSLSDASEVMRALQLIAPALAGSLVFFGGAYLWGVPEMSQLIRLAQTKLRAAARVV